MLYGIGINCVNILVVLFWCVYWPLDCVLCLLGSLFAPTERADRQGEKKGGERGPSVVIRRDSLSFRGLALERLDALSIKGRN